MVAFPYVLMRYCYVFQTMTSQVREARHIGRNNSTGDSRNFAIGIYEYYDIYSSAKCVAKCTCASASESRAYFVCQSPRFRDEGVDSILEAGCSLRATCVSILNYKAIHIEVSEHSHLALHLVKWLALRLLSRSRSGTDRH
jgi:hypothetical protein